MFRGNDLPVKLPYTEGGVLGEPYTMSTDQYVTDTDVTYLLESENIRLTGNPFIGKPTDAVPMVNPSRYNVVRLKLPDMNKFIMPPKQGRLSLQTEVKVWKVIGLRVDCQGSLCPAVTGNKDTKFTTTDAGASTTGTVSDEYLGMEHKQVQLLSIGTEPLLGVYETIEGTLSKDSHLVRKQIPIEDGMLHDFGWGNTDFLKTSLDKRRLPVELQNCTTPVTIPDELGMASDRIGNHMFFLWKKCAAGIRHTLWDPKSKNLNDPTGEDTARTCEGLPDPTRSVTAGMVTSMTDLFNRNYWLDKARGPNNCVCWKNEIYVTFVDNTRGHIHTLVSLSDSVEDEQTEEQNEDEEPELKNDNKIANLVHRHVKEFKVSVIVRLCHVKLEAKLITYLLRFNAEWLKVLGFDFQTGPKKSGFRELNEPDEETEEEEELKLRVIDVDPNGASHFGARFQHSVNAHHPLSTELHFPILESAADAKQQRGRKTASIKPSKR
ncbi:L1 [Wels catfish papillomavirus 1]|nr:L1 [Wels catfish papillomavirus 1]